MALESARNGDMDEALEENPKPHPGRPEDNQGQLTGLWYWVPVMVAATGGSMIATLLGLATFTAADAESTGYAVTFDTAGFLGLLAPPVTIAAIIHWINGQMKSDPAGCETANRPQTDPTGTRSRGC